MRSVWFVGLIAVVGCGDDAPEPEPRENAGQDAGREAGRDAADPVLDGGHDAGRDAGFDALVEIGRACEADRAFAAAHTACTRDSDCAIAGSCSGGWGFYAVQTSARAEAQARSDDTLCKVFDGPMFDAVCEQSVCIARATGRWCGMPATDGGSPDVCEPGSQRYITDCDAGTASCRRRCDGADDSRCECALTTVSTSAHPYATDCTRTVDVWLCR